MRWPCGRARRLLWPEVDPRAKELEIALAQVHVEQCESCRRFIDEMHSFARGLRALGSGEAAPLELRERLGARIARERAPHTALIAPRYRAGLALLLVAMVSIAGVTFWLTGGSGTGLLSTQAIGAVVEDHLRALHQQAIQSTDRAVIERWLTDHVPMAVHVPTLAGASLEGARICYLNGSRGAVIRYRVDGKPVSYFVMPEHHTPATQSSEVVFHAEVQAGYNVITWRHDGLMHALVGDLPRPRLARLARMCAKRRAAPEPTGTPAGVRMPGTKTMHFSLDAKT